MDNRLVLPGMVLSAGIIFAIVIIATLGSRPGSVSKMGQEGLQGPTGALIASGSDAVIMQEGDDNIQVEIRNDELSKCCSLAADPGEGRGCYVLNGKDCSYCSSYCEII